VNVVRPATVGEVPVPAAPRRQATERLGSGMIAAITIAVLFLATVFEDAVSSSRLLPILVALLGWHVLLCPRILVVRETWLYGSLVTYLSIALLWTPDVELALIVLFPAIDVLLAMLLIGSLYAYHDRRAVFTGMVVGAMLASATYTVVTGYPLSVPRGFSYNAIAIAYVSALFLMVMYGCMLRAHLAGTALALLFLLHVAATTSIKATLGVAAGALAAGLYHLPVSLRLLRRNLVLLLLSLAAATYVVMTNQALLERMQYAFARIGTGLRVLQVREDVQGYSGFNERNDWMELGLSGARDNPLFGHGVEAFRATYGMTSHSTMVDLLYNNGLIGCALFYSIFLSLGLRLLKYPRDVSRATSAAIMASIICFLSMSFSGNLFYHPLVGACLALSAAVLSRKDQRYVHVPS
jgi:hypothetical protein